MYYHFAFVFHFPWAIIFWVIYLLVFLPEFKIVGKSMQTVSSSQDKGTLRLIVVGQFISVIIGIMLSFLPWFIVPWEFTFFIVGICLLCLGSLLRRICFRILGKYFTGKVSVTPEQPIIDRGPYRWVRHPSYTCGFIIFLGIGLALGNILSTIFLFTATIFIYLRRVRVEEDALLQIVGEPYRIYMNRTKRFIPFIV